LETSSTVYENISIESVPMLGCLNPNLGQIWTNPNVGLKMSTFTFNCKFFNYIFNPTFGFVKIWPKFGL